MVDKVCRNCVFGWTEDSPFITCMHPKNTLDKDGTPLKIQPYMGPNQFCEHWSDEVWPPSTRTPPKPCGPVVIILGAGITRGRFRYILERNPGAFVWTMNTRSEPESTGHFEIHDEPERPEVIEELKKRGVAVWTKDTYPRATIQRDRLASTVCYALALALSIGAQSVYLPGCDWGEDYDEVRNETEARGAEYWVGALEATGCYVWWSPLAKFMYPFNYGGKWDASGNM